MLSSIVHHFSLKRIVVGSVWLLSCYAAVQHEMANLAVIGTAFYLIFTNLGEREPGTMSAYSVFNEGFKEIDGTLNASQIEGELLHRQSRASSAGAEAESEPPVAEGTEDCEWEGEEDRQLQLALERSMVHTSGEHAPKPKQATRKRGGKKKGRKIG